MKTTVIIIVILSMYISGCKKSGGSSSGDDTPAYIGKWTLVNRINWHTSSGTLHKDTTAAHTGEYIEFKKDGTLTECNYAGGELNYLPFNYQVINNVLYCSDFPDGTKVKISGGNLTLDASDPSNVESLWWNYKK